MRRRYNRYHRDSFVRNRNIYRMESYTESYDDEEFNPFIYYHENPRAKGFVFNYRGVKGLFPPETELRFFVERVPDVDDLLVPGAEDQYGKTTEISFEVNRGGKLQSENYGIFRDVKSALRNLRSNEWEPVVNISDNNWSNVEILIPGYERIDDAGASYFTHLVKKFKRSVRR